MTGMPQNRLSPAKTASELGKGPRRCLPRSETAFDATQMLIAHEGHDNADFYFPKANVRKIASGKLFVTERKSWRMFGA